MTMQNFYQASERYKNACAMMKLKEKLK